ncbi:MAG: tetratricopeptide repeat protein, partial [Planctomycetaceae bacterium]
TVTIETSFGQKHIVQGVTKITPRYLTVTALTHKWEHGLSLTSIPNETLDAILRKATDPKNPDDRMMIARFYLQAGLYHLAAAELDSIIRDFPELRARVEEVLLELRQLRGRQFLTELRRRREAGQHELAYQFLRQFPVQDMSAAVLRAVREMTAEYERSAEQIEAVRLLLGELQAQLSDAERIAAAASLRSVIGERIDHASLPRLEAFLRLKDDETLPPEEKLALAYSGWMLGSGNAITDFDATVGLANARFLMLEYCREDDPQERRSLLGEIARLESLGPQTIASLIPLLPPVIETPGIEPGKPMTLEIPGGEEGPAVRYSVLLPQEYTPHHSYPLIIA